VTLTAEYRPRLFIGSSSEGLQIAKALQVGLDQAAEVTLWSQGVFGLSQGTLDELVRASREFEFAVLVLTPDDLIERRGTATNSPRDNVIFEVGLFIGALGRERTFIVYCQDTPPAIPSDLAGVTAATFRQRADGNLRAAVGSPCTLIEDSIHKVLEESYPKLNVRVRHVGGMKYRVIIDCLSNTPFQCQYIYKLVNNNIVSGLPLEWTTIAPSPQKRRYNSDDEVNRPEGEHLVLKFSYRDIFDATRPRTPRTTVIEQVYEGSDQSFTLKNENVTRCD
jgi:hypothetical protein